MLSFDFAKRYTKSHLAECCYAECRDAKIKVTKIYEENFIKVFEACGILSLVHYTKTRLDGATGFHRSGCSPNRLFTEPP
jgi:hypothetical protein